MAHQSCGRHLEVVDHCHEHGHVRGLLCGGCNKADGMLGGDVERVLGLARYLQGTKLRVS